MAIHTESNVIPMALGETSTRHSLVVVVILIFTPIVFLGDDMHCRMYTDSGFVPTALLTGETSNHHPSDFADQLRHEL